MWRDRVQLSTELKNLEEINRKYHELRIPQECQRSVLELLIFAVNNVFRLGVFDPWNADKYNAWSKMLSFYQDGESYDGVKTRTMQTIEELKEREEEARRLAQDEDWHWEND
jgi:hypothetical protein